MITVAVLTLLLCLTCLLLVPLLIWVCHGAARRVADARGALAALKRGRLDLK